MKFIAEGFRMVFMDRRYWRYIVVPWFWSAAIFVGVVVLGYFAVVPFLQGFVEGRLGAGSGFTGLAKAFISLVYAAIWFFIAGFVFLLITSITSSFLWDELSQKIQEQITGLPAPKSTLSNGRMIMDSLARGTFAIVMAILSVFCGWIIPFVAPVLIAGWLGVLDYTSPTFMRYDRTVDKQWPVATKMKGWFGFQVGSGLISLLPLVNVLLLPALVAGGTLLAVRSGVLNTDQAAS